MKIVMIISGLGIGGAEISLFNIVRELKADNDVRVISLGAVGSIGERIQQLGVPVIALGMVESGAFNTMLRLVRLLREFSPDVMHTWMYHADLLGGIAGRIAGTPRIIWSIHTSNLNPGMLKAATRHIIRICSYLSWFIPTRILSCSTNAVAIHRAINYCPEKFVFIPNGIDTLVFRRYGAAYRSLREELNVSLSSPLVGLIGRFDIQKNHIGFVRAAGIINKHRPDVNFVLAGSGVDSTNRAIADEIERQQLGSVMHLLGARSDIPMIMSALDVLVSSSDGEAFPLVLGEAMACETPCVVTDVGDSALIVGDTGISVPKGDVDGLAEGVLRILALSHDKRISLGQNARKRIQDNFELANIAKRYFELYSGKLSA